MFTILLLSVIIILLFGCGVYVNATGEKYNLEIYNIMQILKPSGAVVKNGTIIKSPVSDCYLYLYMDSNIIT